MDLDQTIGQASRLHRLGLHRLPRYDPPDPGEPDQRVGVETDQPLTPLSRSCNRGPLGSPGGSRPLRRGPGRLLSQRRAEASIGTTVLIATTGPPDDPQRPGENPSITRRWPVRGAGGVDRPRSTSSVATYADADRAGAIDGVIHNFSPVSPSDIVLG